MSSLLSAAVAFSLWIAAHLIVWRFRRPAGQYATLAGLWVAVLVGSVIGLSVIPIGNPAVLTPVPTTGLDYLNFVMLYAALALAYFVTYSAIQADSPTMTILLRLGEAGGSGLTRERLSAELTDDVLVTPRLDDLVVGSLVQRHGERYVISPRGRVLARTYVWYRRLLTMEKGG